MLWSWKVFGVALGLAMMIPRLLYKDEEGNLQSKLQDAWITIDDLQKRALSRHIAFVNVMASMVSSLSDRVFGRKLFSFQSSIVSACFSVVSACSIVMLAELYVHRNIGSTILSVFLFFLCIGTIPAVIPFFTKSKARQKRYIFIWLVVMLTLATVKIILPYLEIFQTLLLVKEKEVFTFFSLLSLGVLLSLGFFVFFIIVSRLGFRRLSSSKSASQVALASFLNTSPVFIMYLISKLGWARISHSQMLSSIDPKDLEQIKTAFASWGNQLDAAIAVTLILIFLFGLVFLIPAIFFILFSAVMILHRALWPVMQRPLYQLQELEVERRNKYLTILGLTLIDISLELHTYFLTILKAIFTHTP